MQIVKKVKKKPLSIQNNLQKKYFCTRTAHKAKLYEYVSENWPNEKKLGVVITDGVGFHFILSDFFGVAEKLFDEVVTISCLPDHIYKDFVRNQELLSWMFLKKGLNMVLGKKEIPHLQIKTIILNSR
jgi:hypothetical protein